MQYKPTEERRTSILSQLEYQIRGSASYLQVFQFATLQDKCMIGIAFLCCFAIGCSLCVMIDLFGDLVDAFFRVEAFTALGETDQKKRDLLHENLVQKMKYFGIGCCAIGFVHLFMGYMCLLCTDYSAKCQILHVRNQYMKILLQQDPNWIASLDKTITESLASNFRAIYDGAGEKLGMLLFSATRTILLTLHCVFHSWKLSVVLLTTAPIAIIVSSIASKIHKCLSETQLERYISYSEPKVTWALCNLKTVKTYNSEAEEARKYKHCLNPCFKIGVCRGIFSGIEGGLIWIFVYTIYGFCFWYSSAFLLQANNVQDEKISPKNFLIIFLSVLEIITDVTWIMENRQVFIHARAASESVLHVLNHVPPIGSTDCSGKYIQNFQGVIKFVDVCFSYASKPEVKIFAGLNIVINKGEKIAIIGPPDSGKTTFMNMIRRFYDPVSGAVTLDGINISEFSLYWLRNVVQMIESDHLIRNGTISHNIRSGEQSITQEDIEKASEKLNIHNFIMQYSEAYNTMLGDEGIYLSKDKQQQMMMIRIIIKKPHILLLDNAFSALDATSEIDIMKLLFKECKNSSIIFVSRLSSVIMTADKSILLPQGIIFDMTKTKQLLQDHDNLNYISPGISQTCSRSSLTHLKDQKSILRTQKLQKIVVHRRPVPVFLPKSQHVLPYPQKMNVDKDMPQVVTLRKLMCMHTKEWHFIAVGCLSSMIIGISLTVYAVLFGEVLQVAAVQFGIKYINVMYHVRVFLTAGVITGIATLLQQYMFTIAEERFTRRVRRNLFKTLLEQDLAWFDRDENFIDKLNCKLYYDADNVKMMMCSFLAAVMQALASVASAVGLSMYYDWKLGLAALALVPILLLDVYAYVKVLVSTSPTEAIDLDRFAMIVGNLTHFCRSMQNHEMLLMAESMHESEFKNNRPRLLGSDHARALVFGAFHCISILAYSLIMWFAININVYHDLSISQVVRVTEAIIIATIAIAYACIYSPNYTKGKQSLTRLLQLTYRRTSMFGGLPWNQDLVYFGQFELSNVNFSYKSAEERNVFSNLNLSIKSRHKVGIVGPQGSGKSTLLYLLIRFYDPDEGYVVLDGTNIMAYGIKTLRKKMSFVPQISDIFDGTVRENIEYGDTTRQILMEEILVVAEMANAHNFITALPEGYDTIIGNNGYLLSPDQKFRLSLARALIKDPTVLLIDGPVSPSDHDSQLMMQRGIHNSCFRRTSVITTENPIYIEDADYIFVLQNGRVAKEGSPAELLKENNYYKNMWTNYKRTMTS